MKRFEGKVALITGAASGIGAASAARLAEEGARLVITDVQESALREQVAALSARGAEVHALVADIANPTDAEQSVREATSRFGRLDVLCNIAGILQFRNTHEVALEDWNRVIGVNLTGTFLMCRAALPALLATRGNIVNMSSTAALAGHPWTAAYSASKGGVLALTYTLAIEYGRQGLRANALCPGSIKTPITKAFQVPPGADVKLVERIMPLDTFRGPETVASAVAFLASDDAAHINGVELRVDGATLS